MIVRQLFDKETSTYTYLLADEDTRQAVIIDPVVEQVDRDLTLIGELGLDLVLTLDTHVHADHVTGSGRLREATGAASVVSAASQVPCADHKVVHGDHLRFGRYALKVLATPGHTDGCVSYLLEADGQTMVFTGDALMIRGCGRTDFQQGDPRTLYRSVHEQLFTLPDATTIYPGHDYRGHRSSTVGEERVHNPRLNMSVSEAGFVHLMNALNLASPKRMGVAVPANLACGLVDEGRAKQEAPFEVVHPSELSSLDGFTVVDVRQREELYGTLGHLPGVTQVPMSRLREEASRWDRSTPLLLVCRSGRRSAVAGAILSAMDFSDITNLAGGMIAWRRHEQLGVPA